VKVQEVPSTDLENFMSKKGSEERAEVKRCCFTIERIFSGNPRYRLRNRQQNRTSIPERSVEYIVLIQVGKSIGGCMEQKHSCRENSNISSSGKTAAHSINEKCFIEPSVDTEYTE
jgi:hypothetical protein